MLTMSVPFYLVLLTLLPTVTVGQETQGAQRDAILRNDNRNVYESSISVGSGYFCGISASSEVYCWGTDPETGDSIVKPKVVPAADGVEFVAVDVGLRFLCALSVDGEVYCKGAGYNGELGSGVNEVVLDDLNVPVVGDTKFRSISVGYYHVCAIDRNNDLLCWGDNEYGQLGAGDIQYSNVPVKVGENFKQVSSGGEHTCAVTLGNEGFCWGRNDMHQSSPSDSYIISRPRKIGGKWDSIYSGYDYTLGINKGGEGYGWGVSEGISGESAAGGYLGQGRDFCLDFNTGKILCDSDGSQGGGLLTFEKNPTKIQGSTKWSMFAPGRVPCGIAKDSGYLYCWGYTAGEAYAEGSPGSNIPNLVSKKTWEQVASGISGARCALDSSGEAYCWGRNVYDCGETCPLGDGTVDNSAKPLKVKSADVWRASKVVKVDESVAPQPSIPLEILPAPAPLELPIISPSPDFNSAVTPGMALGPLPSDGGTLPTTPPPAISTIASPPSAGSLPSLHAAVFLLTSTFLLCIF